MFDRPSSAPKLSRLRHQVQTLDGGKIIVDENDKLWIRLCEYIIEARLVSWKRYLTADSKSADNH